LPNRALILNIAVFLLVAGTLILWLTLIPYSDRTALLVVTRLVAVALPIIGAIKTNQGIYFRYPVVEFRRGPERGSGRPGRPYGQHADN
jgi:hypothetical protein